MIYALNEKRLLRLRQSLSTACQCFLLFYNEMSQQTSLFIHNIHNDCLQYIFNNREHYSGTHFVSLIIRYSFRYFNKRLAYIRYSRIGESKVK